MRHAARDHGPAPRTRSTPRGRHGREAMPPAPHHRPGPRAPTAGTPGAMTTGPLGTRCTGGRPSIVFRSRPATSSSTWDVERACASSGWSSASVRREPWSAWSRRPGCGSWPPSGSPRAAGPTCCSSPPPWRARYSRRSTTPSSAPCTTSCSPRRPSTTSSRTCATAVASQRPAGSGRRSGRSRSMRGCMALHAPFVRNFAGFHRPWALLAERVPGLSVEEVASGHRVRGLGARAARPGLTGHDSASAQREPRRPHRTPTR